MAENARILVVDDESHLADGIAENLVADGYTVEIAHDGQAGLAAALDGKFDLIVLDVMMPRMDGITVCARLRAAGVQKASKPEATIISRNHSISANSCCVSRPF